MKKIIGMNMNLENDNTDELNTSIFSVPFFRGIDAVEEPPRFLFLTSFAQELEVTKEHCDQRF